MACCHAADASAAPEPSFLSPVCPGVCVSQCSPRGACHSAAAKLLPPPHLTRVTPAPASASAVVLDSLQRVPASVALSVLGAALSYMHGLHACPPGHLSWCCCCWENCRRQRKAAAILCCRFLGGAPRAWRWRDVCYRYLHQMTPMRPAGGLMQPLLRRECPTQRGTEGLLIDYTL